MMLCSPSKVYWHPAGYVDWSAGSKQGYLMAPRVEWKPIFSWKNPWPAYNFNHKMSGLWGSTGSLTNTCKAQWSPSLLLGQTSDWSNWLPTSCEEISNFICTLGCVHTASTASRSQQFEEVILRLFCHVPTSAYSISLAIPMKKLAAWLSPTISNFLMEDLTGQPISPSAGCYMDDTFIFWPHSSKKLSDFPDHLNVK